MNREELGASLNLKIELIPEGRPNRHGAPIIPSKITVHNTSNTSSGADADAHSNFVRYKGYYELNGRKNWVSWHYTVDDRQVVKQLPINEKAIHSNRTANATSIAIEICMHREIDQDVADDRAARLVAILCYDLRLKTSDVVTHKFWTGKNCPQLLLAKWDSFITKVQTYLDSISSTETSDDSVLRILSFDLSKVELTDTMCWEDQSIRVIAKSRYKTMAQVAINWCICKGTIPIPGAKNLQQAQQNVGAMSWRLDSGEVAELDKEAAKVKKAMVQNPFQSK